MKSSSARRLYLSLRFNSMRPASWFNSSKRRFRDRKIQSRWFNLVENRHKQISL